jgi:hypothetical protein
MVIVIRGGRPGNDPTPADVERARAKAAEAGQRFAIVRNLRPESHASAFAWNRSATRTCRIHLQIPTTSATAPAAIELDTLQGYEDFLAAYPNEPLANRVRALMAARREAITWRYVKSYLRARRFCRQRHCWAAR